MTQKTLIKMAPKHRVWWRHGKHKGGVVVAVQQNKQAPKKYKEVEAINTSKSDWSTKKR